MLTLLACVASVSLIAASVFRNSLAVPIAWGALALLAMGWQIIRAATGIQVRNRLKAGLLDTRLAGIGSSHYSWILALGSLSAVLAWTAVNVQTAVSLVFGFAAATCAWGIGRIRSGGYRQRQEKLMEALK